ncbi:MAG: CRISPR-associated endonuclease Cas1, partial [Cyanobacteria bacterium P01_D01_bin.2]
MAEALLLEFWDVVAIPDTARNAVAQRSWPLCGGLLFNNVFSLIRAEGLDPYLGNLHRSDRREAQLAFDLMEEFRSPIVDTLVLSVINQQVLHPDDFQPPNDKGGVYLRDDARRRFLQAFEQRMMQTVGHGDAADPIPY